MPQSYTPELKKKIVRLHEEEGRTYKSITGNTAYQKPVSPSDVENYAKNARQAPNSKQNTIP